MILTSGLSVYRQTTIQLIMPLPEAKLDKFGRRDPVGMMKVTTFGAAPLLRDTLAATVVEAGIEMELSDQDIARLVSDESVAELRNYVLSRAEIIGDAVQVEIPVNSRIDGFFNGRATLGSAERDGNISPKQLQLAQAFKDTGLLGTGFDWRFLTPSGGSDTRA